MLASWFSLLLPLASLCHGASIEPPPIFCELEARYSASSDELTGAYASGKCRQEKIGIRRSWYCSIPALDAQAPPLTEGARQGFPVRRRTPRVYSRRQVPPQQADGGGSAGVARQSQPHGRLYLFAHQRCAVCPCIGASCHAPARLLSPTANLLEQRDSFSPGTGISSGPTRRASARSAGTTAISHTGKMEPLSSPRACRSR